jgi:hypothetical protein
MEDPQQQQQQGQGQRQGQQQKLKAKQKRLVVKPQKQKQQQAEQQQQQGQQLQRLMTLQVKQERIINLAELKQEVNGTALDDQQQQQQLEQQQQQGVEERTPLPGYNPDAPPISHSIITDHLLELLGDEGTDETTAGQTASQPSQKLTPVNHTADDLLHAAIQPGTNTSTKRPRVPTLMVKEAAKVISKSPGRALLQKILSPMTRRQPVQQQQRQQQSPLPRKTATAVAQNVQQQQQQQSLQNTGQQVQPNRPVHQVQHEQVFHTKAQPQQQLPLQQPMAGITGQPRSSSQQHLLAPQAGQGAEVATQQKQSWMKLLTLSTMTSNLIALMGLDSAVSPATGQTGQMRILAQDTAEEPMPPGQSRRLNQAGKTMPGLPKQQQHLQENKMELIVSESSIVRPSVLTSNLMQLMGEEQQGATSRGLKQAAKSGLLQPLEIIHIVEVQGPFTQEEQKNRTALIEVCGADGSGFCRA